MDFFAAQHRARRNSRWWIFLFLLLTTVATIAIYAVAVAVLIALIFVALFRNAEALRPYLNETSLIWTCLAVGGAITAFMLHGMRRIARAGGEGLAERLGGRRIARATIDPAEQRLINVTEEMAVAAGIPPPLVYVLDRETSLNAFAAGLSARDGIVCVTKGLLEAMSRDELQGVVGHEISHLVNGDSRLNLRLTAGLYGLYFVTVLAEGMMKVELKEGEDGGGILFGIPLYIAGWFGRLSAEIIQAAVSREREYLADASSVQYTRNPAGLASALRKLLKRGSRIRSPQSAAASHFFFSTAGSPRFFTGVFATHPPLEERIKRLGGARSAVSSDEASFATFLGADGKADKVFCDVVEELFPEGGIVQAQSLLAGLPEDLRRHSRSVAGAAGIVCGLFFSDQENVRTRQEPRLPATSLPVAQALHRWLSAQPEQDAHYRLVWMDLALPALRSAPEGEFKRLFPVCETLIREDGRVSPGEFALYSLLRSVLRPASEKTRNAELRPAQLDRDIGTLLALIAHAGSADETTARSAYQAALAASPAQSRPPLPPQSALSISAVEQALTNLSQARAPYRDTVLRACAVAVRHDGKITPVEIELLRAFAQSLDCPAPL